MKTIKQVKQERPEYSRLIVAVVDRISKESIQDVINNGIGGGFRGFTYYSDTTKFFKAYRKEILSLAEDMSRDLGEDILTMIQGFNCLGKDYSINDIGEALYSGKGDCSTEVQNAMAWFAAEEVCRMFED